VVHVILVRFNVKLTQNQVLIHVSAKPWTPPPLCLKLQLPEL